MIRIVLFLLALAVIASGIAWVADRPGEISITWIGYRVETSVMIAAFAIAALVIVAVIVWSAIRAIMRSPEQVSLFLRHRRVIRGYIAVSRGLIAIGSGDATLARKSAADAARLTPGDPLALLLAAQSAQLTGDRAGAEQAFHAMLDKPETRQLGLRGLYVEAERRNDAAAAYAFAEQAAAAAPALPWAGQAVLNYRCGAGDWSGALVAHDAMKGTLDKSEFRRKRAVLLTARALARHDTDRDAALADALDAVRFAPDLVPAAVYAGRRLAEANNARKARKILETAWVANPHPDLAGVYADVRPGDSARERFNRIKKLVEKAPASIEAGLALSRAALDARDFKAAREALKSYVPAPTARVAALMADIEQSENGDIGRAREWMARAMRAAPDPAWTADGVVSDRWLPLSPVTGALDAFQWKVPLAEIGIERPVIDEAALSPPVVVAAGSGAPVIEPAQPPDKSASRPRHIMKKTPVAAAEAVIPQVHVPDDPGPDLTLEPDPLPQPPAAAWLQPWQKIRQLLR